MNIGQFSDSFMPIVDGVGRVVFNYASYIGKKGHESYVIAPYGKTGYRGNLGFDIVTYTGAPLPSSPQYKVGIPILDRHYHKRIEEVRLDIVHAHSPFLAGQEAIRIATARDVPIIGTFHSKYYDDFYSVTQSEMLATLGVKYVVNYFERCTEVWSVSHSSAETLRSYGYKGDIRVMENGTDRVEIGQADSKQARQDFNLPDLPILLYVGQIHVKKNLRTVIRASAELHNMGVAHTLVLCGQGPDMDMLKAEVDQLGIAPSTVFTGHISDMSLLLGLYSLASLFVFPSLYDTAGLVVKEAATMGTPSIVVRGSSAAEIIVDGENGFLCDDSPESIASVAQAALANAKNTQLIGENAMSTLPKDWDDVVDDVIANYNRVIKEYSQSSMSTKLQNTY